ncbi:hypothetical protein BX286_0219 [Streptomyces sp. 3211.6]|uniref:SH3 domain-containing protein n=1 Tax=Streptomyces TaxID=1883 RepID=UPI000CA76488|nr:MULTISPECIES: SH3 domain-containing protein [Streptomyces]RKT02326.1 hypothetical protein BX286_0219 [Streptomyces sp. 3211.6]RPF43645.1 hypothetical protein EDD96_0146 [Streptomyces sp. Ag109_G2-6]
MVGRGGPGVAAAGSDRTPQPGPHSLGDARAADISTAVGVLRRGEPFTPSVTDGAWLHVTTASGITGWVDDGDLPSTTALA